MIGSKYSIGMEIVISDSWRPEKWYDRMLEVAREVPTNQTDSVNVFCDRIYEEDEKCGFLHGEYADENTLKIVHRTIFDLYGDRTMADTILRELQNAGILFRQRR